MKILHKILVNNETGKIIQPVHTIDDPRPQPPDATWITIMPGTALYNHFSMDPPVDISHIDLDNTYWNFTTNTWVEVISPPPTSLSAQRHARNNWLKNSDRHYANSKTAHEKTIWTQHRQQLRSLFDDRHSTVEHSAVFTGYILENILTVTAVTSGIIKRAAHIEGTGVADNTYIELHSAHIPALTGNGGVGTYQITPGQTVGSADAPVSLEAFDYSTVVFPRTPSDIQALKDLAAAGDITAQAIITRDGL
jgi:hypothetical protein